MSDKVFEEFLLLIDEKIEAGELEIVFWTCSIPDHKDVTWSENSTVATCNTCGKTNKDRNESSFFP